MARRNKPKTPEQVLAEKLARRTRDFEVLNLQPEAASLPAYADVETQREGQKHGNRAWRSNVFRLLLERKSITTSHHDAAYHLIADWAAWRGLDGRSDTFGQFVDGGCGCAELITDRMIRAGREVGRALAAVDDQSKLLLSAFMLATVEEDRAMAWRGIAQRCGVQPGQVKVGDEWKDRQVVAVTAALEGLRVYYQEPGRVAA